MVLIGLGILIASISFLCYRHPPASWSFLGWLQKHTLEGGAKTQTDTPSIDLEEPKPTTEEPSTAPPIAKAEETKVKLDRKATPVISFKEPKPEPSVPPAIVPEAKHELDRKAMPPPPPPFKKPTPKSLSATTTPDPFAGLRTPTVPSFAIGQDGAEEEREEEEEEYVPSFPAANSAQRASGGARAPPRLPSLQPSSNSLMAPPPKPSPLPNRGPPSSASSSSLSLPPTHNSIPTKPRKKVLLTPGHSPLDWARLSSSPSANLRGLPPSTPYLRVPPSLLKTMTGRKGKNAWTVLGGKVYNITPYLPYHPGGEPELLRCAGRDGSRLFGEVHPWVNWEGMLEGCLVGIAVEESEVVGRGNLEEMD